MPCFHHITSRVRLQIPVQIVALSETKTFKLYKKEIIFMVTLVLQPGLSLYEMYQMES